MLTVSLLPFIMCLLQFYKGASQKDSIGALQIPGQALQTSAHTIIYDKGIYYI